MRSAEGVGAGARADRVPVGRGVVRAMELFGGKTTNKLDAKGRVSLPAKFRAVASAQGASTLYCFPSFQGAFIEGGGPQFRADLQAMLDRLDPFSEEHDQLADVVIGAGVDLSFDKDGRVVLPEELRAYAGIGHQVTFVGLGRKFQIWEPSAYEAFHAQSIRNAHQHRGLLKSLSARPVDPSNDRGGR